MVIVVYANVSLCELDEFGSSLVYNRVNMGQLVQSDLT